MEGSCRRERQRMAMTIMTPACWCGLRTSRVRPRQKFNGNSYTLLHGWRGAACPTPTAPESRRRGADVRAHRRSHATVAPPPRLAPFKFFRSYQKKQTQLTRFVYRAPEPPGGYADCQQGAPCHQPAPAPRCAVRPRAAPAGQRERGLQARPQRRHQLPTLAETNTYILKRQRPRAFAIKTRQWGIFPEFQPVESAAA